MNALAHRSRNANQLSSVVLLETAKGAELHLRSQAGTLMRVPLKGADHDRGLAALALMAQSLDRKRRPH